MIQYLLSNISYNCIILKSELIDRYCDKASIILIYIYKKTGKSNGLSRRLKQEDDEGILKVGLIVELIIGQCTVVICDSILTQLRLVMLPESNTRNSFYNQLIAVL